jgi:hypothetical protein
VYALVDDLGVFKGKWHVKDLKPDRFREVDNETVSSSPEPSDGEREDSDGNSGMDTDTPRTEQQRHLVIKNFGW